jgi:hypothetical protein
MGGNYGCGKNICSNEKKSAIIVNWKRKTSAKINGSQLTTGDHGTIHGPGHSLEKHHMATKGCQEQGSLQNLGRALSGVVRRIEASISPPVSKTPKKILLSENEKFPAPPPLNQQSNRDTKKILRLLKRPRAYNRRLLVPSETNQGSS